MRILHITSITNPQGNGVAVAVSNYYKYEKELVDVAIYNVEKDIIKDKYSYNISNFKTISSLPDGFDSPDLVIFNEVYKPIYLRFYKECLKNKIPYIIIPHGCLMKKAQNKSKIKKKVANVFLFNRFIKKSLAVQFLNSKEEDESILNYSKHIISGNGIDSVKEKNVFKNKDFVYIGRYEVETKGLDLLIGAARDNKEWFVDNKVKIQLYGRSANRGYEETKALIEKNNLCDIVILNDAIYERQKHKKLLESYAFIQASRHEAQGLGIMEALSYGLPCIVTYGTPFGKYVEDKKCGIGINCNKRELFAAIKKMYEDETFRNNCSKNAKTIEKDFSWKNIIQDCVEQYRGLL